MKDRVIYEAILFIVTFIIVLFVYKFINMPKKKKKQKKDPISWIIEALLEVYLLFLAWMFLLLLLLVVFRTLG